MGLEPRVLCLFVPYTGFFLLPAIPPLHFVQLSSLVSSPHFLFFKCTSKKLLQSPCQPRQPLLHVWPLWPWLCPDSLILQFFCLTFLWFGIFPSIHFLSSGFCHLCSTLNILAVFWLSTTLVIRRLHAHLLTHRLLLSIFPFFRPWDFVFCAVLTLVLFFPAVHPALLRFGPLFSFLCVVSFTWKASTLSLSGAFQVRPCPLPCFSLQTYLSLSLNSLLAKVCTEVN